MCTPTRTNFTTTMAEAEAYIPADEKYLILIVASVHDEFGNESYFATPLMRGSSNNTSMSFIAFVNSNGIHRTLQQTSVKKLYETLFTKAYTVYPDSNFAGLSKEGYAFYQYYMQVVTEKIKYETEDAQMVAMTAEVEKIGMTLEQAYMQAESFGEIEQYAQQNGLKVEWIEKATKVTITAPTQQAIDRLKAEDETFKAYANSPYNALIVPLIEILNDGQDIVIHSCMQAVLKTQ